MMKIAPSILSADFSKLGEEVEKLQRCGADWIHVDVMDGVFVPNITIGPSVIQQVRRYASIPFDVHLMIIKPERYLEQFAKAGADLITVHIEACDDPKDAIDKIHQLGKKAGISLNPKTPFSAVEPFMHSVDLLLVMSVEPGFGGQSFMPEVIPKIQEARRFIDKHQLHCEIEVDGGINCDTAVQVSRAGATVLAAGSALFKCSDIRQEIANWRERCPV